MTKQTIYLITALICTNACDCNPANSTNQGLINPPVSTPGPPANELLDVMQGRWQNEADTSLAVEIIDDLMTHTSGGVAQEECVIEAFSDCQNVFCKSDSAMAPQGWCFIEKGKTDTVCYEVLQCDSIFRYRVFGSKDAVASSFKKI